MHIPKKRYQVLEQAMRHVPEELLKLRIKCPNAECGTVFDPPWLKKRPPLTPVRPNSGQSRWLPIGARVECPNCRMNVDFPLPVEKQKARYWLFGDEAYRDIDDTYLLTYSLVGTNNVRLLKVEEDIKDFKLRLCPSVSPDSWRLHMKDIWPENERKRHPLFNCWDYNFVRDFVDGFFELIRGFDEAFVKYNVSAIYHKSKSKKQRRLEKREVRHQAYSVLLMKVIDEATKSGVQPNFMFDSDKDSEGDNVIHGWAKDVFQGSQLNLLYCFLARGIEIPEPVFVSPASRPCLEVADFMSYVVARYCYRRIKGELTDLDPKQLGPVTYIGFDPSGDMLFQKSTGYPWHFFYGSV